MSDRKWAENILDGGTCRTCRRLGLYYSGSLHIHHIYGKHADCYAPYRGNNGKNFKGSGTNTVQEIKAMVKDHVDPCLYYECLCPNHHDRKHKQEGGNLKFTTPLLDLIS